MISAGTLRHPLRILQATINDSLQKAGLVTQEKTPLNSSHLTKDFFADSSKTNYETTNDGTTDNLTINKGLFNCDN